MNRETRSILIWKGVVDMSFIAGYIVGLEDSSPKLQHKSVTENGIVTADSGFDGLSSVDVNVSSGGEGGSGTIISTEGYDEILGLPELGHWTDDNGYTVKAVYGECCGARICFGAKGDYGEKKVSTYHTSYNIFDICIKDGQPLFAVHSGFISKDQIPYNSSDSKYEFLRFEVTLVDSDKIRYKRYYKETGSSGASMEKYQLNAHPFRRLIHTYTSTGVITSSDVIYTKSSVDQLAEAHEYLINHYTY